MPKPAYQILFGFLMLTFTVVACNNNKESKTESTTDTVNVMPMEPVPPIDTSKMDTASTRPVKTPD